MFDKKEWGPGPWQLEPDQDEWSHAGYICRINRSDVSGSLNGYVGLPPSHPFYGKPYDELDSFLDVHGGVTYADDSLDHFDDIEKLRWIGFDTAHAFDLMPRLAAFENEYFTRPIGFQTYCTFDYVRKETNRLAEQCWELRSYPRLIWKATTDKVRSIMSNRGGEND